MSITFSPAPHSPDSLNIANQNARELLTWLGIEHTQDLYGEISASELAALCRRRLWPIKRNEDPGLPASESPRHYVGGRRPGYLPKTTKALLKICESHPGTTINWY